METNDSNPKVEEQNQDFDEDEKMEDIDTEDSDSEEEEEEEFEPLPEDPEEAERNKQLQQIQQERKEKLAKLRAEQMKEAENSTQDKTKKFKYLLQQTEIFSHFMSHSHTSTDKKGKGKKKAAGRKHNLTEEEEDKAIMREAIEESTDVGSVGVRLTVSPSYIQNTKLREYQIDGLNWLIKLYDNSINGILADEMGLGKTLQTISLLGYLKHMRGASGPYLIIAPKSVLSNWINEVRRWVPTLDVFKFHGTLEERAELKATKLKPGKFEVCVTSFEIAIREKAALRRFRWKYLIIDEAHRIKNEKSVLSRCVRLFTSQFRLLLTGTPLQNNLHELWALLNFLLPDVFDSAAEFDSWFNLKEGQAETEIVEQLHKLLKPFMLRRLKVDVERTIPPKKEICVECGMSEMQRTWYRSILAKDANTMANKGGEKMRLLNIVMQLRKCCNHPYLFDGAEPGPPFTTDEHIVANAGKMVMLDRLLHKLKSQGSRILIFTQMTRMLDILEDYCGYRNYEYCRIDGQTNYNDREQQIDEFNKPDSDKFIFLLSTRAGGLGINLATADTVIIYDSDWNPQADLQAQDRAHRIGQKKPVTVFRLITKDSIEEKIYQRAVKKLYLDAVVIQQGRLVDQNKALSRSELMGMIRFGAEEVFRSSQSTITDEDIDELISRGEKKAEEINKTYRENCQNNLLTFALNEDSNLYEFEGLDYSQKPTNMLVIDLSGMPNLIRLSEDDFKEQIEGDVVAATGNTSTEIDSVSLSHEKRSALVYFKNKNSAVKAHDALAKKYRVRYGKVTDQFFHQIAISTANDQLSKRERKSRYGDDTGQRTRSNGPKAPKYHDFQFVNEARLLELWEKERKHAIAKFGGGGAVETTKQKTEETEVVNDITGLTEAETQEKETIMKESFTNWTKKEYQAFIRGCEKYGRENITEIAKEVGDTKTEEEVRAYSAVFWKQWKTLTDADKVIKRIEKGEATLFKLEEYRRLLKWKTSQYTNPWAELELPTDKNRAKQSFTETEDRYLFCMTAQLGYGMWDELRDEIRKAWEFRFDWFFRSRLPADLKTRCEALLRLVEKEYFDEEGPYSQNEGNDESPPSSPSSSKASSAETRKRKRVSLKEKDEAASTPKKAKK